MSIINKYKKIGFLLITALVSSLILAACGDAVADSPPPTTTTARATTTSPAITTTTAPATTTVVPTTTALIITITATTTAATTLTTVAPTTVAPVTPTTLPPTSGDAANGKKLFNEIGCAACHGPLAQGDYGPKIAATKLSYEQVLQQVRNPKGKGPNVMTPFAPEEISDRGVADVYAYLQTLK